MNAGELDKYVMIQRQTESVAANHSVVDTWSDLLGVWCKIKTDSMKENSDGQDIQTDMLTIIMWPTDITHNDRILYNGDVYEIEAVDTIDPSKYVIKAKRNEQGS